MRATQVPYKENSDVQIYSTEYVCDTTLNRVFRRLLANDKILLTNQETALAEMLEISRGYGTTKSFDDYIEIGHLAADHVKFLSTDDFGKFIVMDGKFGSLVAEDKNPCAILPKFSDVDDEMVGQCYTFKALNTGTETGRVSKIFADLNSPVERINFIDTVWDSNLGERRSASSAKVSTTYTSTSGDFTTFCKVILIKIDGIFSWMFSGSSIWVPVSDIDSDTDWTDGEELSY